jgi:hypothetical protein
MFEGWVNSRPRVAANRSIGCCPMILSIRKCLNQMPFQKTSQIKDYRLTRFVRFLISAGSVPVNLLSDNDLKEEDFQSTQRLYLEKKAYKL